ncbi:MAG: glycosyltransferase family 4 protein [Kiritimatiellia bacterium]
MKIALTLQPAVTQQAGIGRYTRELAAHLLPILDPDTQLRLDFFDFRRKAMVPEALQTHNGLHPVRWIPGNVIEKLWNHISFPPYDCIHGTADLVHYTNFLAAPQRKGKAVVSIHDLSFMRFPQYTEARNLRNLKRGILQTAKRADAVITISRFSASEIATFLDIPPAKIHPIHLGISTAFKRPDDAEIQKFRSRNGIERPYLLTVGTLEPRKNLKFLIHLFEHLKDYDGDLLLAGGLGWHYESILEQIQQSPRTKQIRRIGFVPDADLPALYAGADAFLLPSFYEGFGFPPIEAMACETPVVASTGGSLAEVLQDGAILHNHYELDAWGQSILSVIADQPARQERIRRGKTVANQYTWQKTAAETLAVYRKLLS